MDLVTDLPDVGALRAVPMAYELRIGDGMVVVRDADADVFVQFALRGDITTETVDIVLRQLRACAEHKRKEAAL